MYAPSTPEILVIDPDPSIRALLEALLRREGFATDCVGDRTEALRRTAAKRYSATILEPRMAGGDALLSELYAAAPDGRPNMIVITTPDLTTAALPHRAGVIAVLFKPFQLDALYSIVRSCCERASEAGGASSMAARSA